MADDGSSSFESMKVPEVQNFLKARGIQVASDGRKMKRAELQELCKNAAEMKADSACRHVAAALFDLEATIRRNELDTCTSVLCEET
ncbi:hypothetical protein P5673_012121 [Acropora cervicornis]|uniref:Uncharacterized protein n=1 Tax=Acropora cervicornis TaxID=6130 RepID=A0AAD9QNK7_ACRCE|nr:hypothetical protein P5673_012121 [Acropora cervicornis]